MTRSMIEPDEARDHQRRLAPGRAPTGEPAVDRVAALDLATGREHDFAIGSGVMYSRSGGCVLERVMVIGLLQFPYVPGLLAVREAPLLLEVLRRFERQPDCLLVDGHGYAHPRRMGLASHLGLLVDCPSIGCAKQVLVGEHEDPGDRTGSYTDLWHEEPVGYALRSHPRANPIFLSPGHAVGREHTLRVIRPLLDGRTKLPAPLHRADRLAGSEFRRIKRLATPFLEREESVWLVGGALRDLLRGIRPRDYDLLVTGYPKDVREDLVNQFDAHAFPLDEARGTHRIAGEEITVDVTVLENGSVEEDLRRRDFTVNAVALDLGKNVWVDPLSGRRDLRVGKLRVCAPGSLRDDPLRVLRAYRFERTIELTFGSDLGDALRAASDGLSEVSRERIVEELLRLVSGTGPHQGLKRMRKDGVLDDVSFFRPTAVEEVRTLSEWRSLLRDHRLLDTTHHGGVPLISGLMAARLVHPDVLGGWPFHARIRALARASHRPLPNDPGYPILSADRDSLVGRVLGEGIRREQSAEWMGRALARLHRYLARRRELEKQAVMAAGSEENIPARKESVLREEIPAVWKQLLKPLTN